MFIDCQQNNCPSSVGAKYDGLGSGLVNKKRFAPTELGSPFELDVTINIRLRWSLEPVADQPGYALD